MSAILSNVDQEFLGRAIEISRHALEDEGKNSFRRNNRY